MDEREKGERDIKIRRDTDVRGSLGVPPAGSKEDEARLRKDAEEAFKPERGHSDDDDDRMSDR